MRVLCSVKPVVVLAFLLLASVAARADSGLDLVLLVDRSTSMARHRELAPLFVRMTAGVVARNARANGVDHRLAVISFGSTARVDLPFADTVSQIASFQPADLGDTNVLAAFAEAKTLFDGLPSDPARRRAVVLLTDGVPYVRGADMNAYRAALHDFVAVHFKRRGIDVNVMLVGESHRGSWHGLATTIQNAGRAAEEVLAHAHGAVAALVGTRTVESTPAKAQRPVEMLIVPPYLEVIVFDVFHGAADAGVEVFPPSSATPIRGGEGGVQTMRVGNVLATYVVPRPQPGQWIIRKSRPDARVRIVSQQFFPRGVLVKPAATQPLRQYDRLPLAYRIIDGNGQPLRELPEYALSVELSLAKPNGVSTTVGMERAPDLGPAVFRSSHAIECGLPGRYWTEVTVTTVDDSGQRLGVFRDRWSGFSVSPAERVDCRVSASGTTTWLPLSATIDCFDDKASPVDMGTIVTGPPATIFRAELSHDGKPAFAAVDLDYDGRGAFRGSLRGARRSGAYRLQVTADPSRIRAPYNIRFVPPEIAFVRRHELEWIAVSMAATAAALGSFMKWRTTRS